MFAKSTLLAALFAASTQLVSAAVPPGCLIAAIKYDLQQSQSVGDCLSNMNAALNPTHPTFLSSVAQILARSRARSVRLATARSSRKQLWLPSRRSANPWARLFVSKVGDS